MNLDQHIEQIREDIRAGKFSNEAAVSQGIVLRLLNALSWPTYDTQIVCPEYPLEGGRADFALCSPPGKPIAFIEVKQIGQSDGAERQLFEYAFHKGVPLAILTDGREWHFFLPAEQGDYGERRVYKLDIVEREVADSSSRLSRYLKYEAIKSGTAIEAARDDYKSLSRNRLMQDALPTAWTRLVKEEDDLLLELIADQVESLCGYKPDLDTVARFVRERLILGSALQSGSQPPPRKLSPQPTTVSPAGGIPLQTIGFMYRGKSNQARNAKDVLVQVFDLLSRIDPLFLDRFAGLPKHGRTRRYLARDKNELYPGRPDLVRDHSHQLSAGWWLGTNVSRVQIERIIEMACEVARIKYGTDLTINLGE